ncbi:hypothetical protein CBS101457_005439 [Exobasidium rhododendri]|nr:hypothetical protein CBS101457_005439 [Exobasidium rhododendri]
MSSNSAKGDLDSKVNNPIVTTKSAASEEGASNLASPVDVNPKLAAQAARNYVVPDGVDEKKLMRKVDFRIVPWLSVLYLLSFLDRSAIGNAKLYNLPEDLHMSSQQFNFASALFFIPYALFEIPSNILLKRLRPSVWFPIITCLVGICMLSQGLVTSYGGLLTARFFLGVTEAGLFPGANYLLSGWYARREFGLRASIFFSAATISGAFGGLLSAAIHNMNGVGGYEGWRWIFILIGLATFVVGILSIWLCEDFPDTAKFLTEPERECIVNRLQADQKYSAGGESFQWRNVVKAILDWKTWLGMLIYMSIDPCWHARETKKYGCRKEFIALQTLFFSVPIYVFACLVTIGVGFYADRKGNRALINMVMISVGIAGYIILISSRLPGLSYFGIYLAAAGIYPCIPNTIALTSTSIEGAYKRSVVMAGIISFGNINGAATTNVYLAKDKPYYTLGHGIIIMYLAIGFLASFTYYMGLRRSNSRKTRGLCNETILSEEQDATPELRQQAADQRTKLEGETSGLFGGLQALRQRYGEAAGGVYATVTEAKTHKGDAYSGYVYSY